MLRCMTIRRPCLQRNISACHLGTAAVQLAVVVEVRGEWGIAYRTRPQEFAAVQERAGLVRCSAVAPPAGPGTGTESVQEPGVYM